MEGSYARTHRMPWAKNAATWRVVMLRHTLATVLPKYTECCCHALISAADT